MLILCFMNSYNWKAWSLSKKQLLRLSVPYRAGRDFAKIFQPQSLLFIFILQAPDGPQEARAMTNLRSRLAYKGGWWCEPGRAAHLIRIDVIGWNGSGWQNGGNYADGDADGGWTVSSLQTPVKWAASHTVLRAYFPLLYLRLRSTWGSSPHFSFFGISLII